MRTIASVGFSIVGSATVSTRTSRLPCQATAFMAHLGVGFPASSPSAVRRNRPRSGGRGGAGGVEQLVARGELHARAVAGGGGAPPGGGRRRPGARSRARRSRASARG